MAGRSFLRGVLGAGSLLVGIGVFAHGEDRWGPHGGFVRMPGAFHTEVVKKKGQLLVYLLDVQWKNPTTENSSVEVYVKRDGAVVGLDCKPKQSAFLCSLPPKEKLDSGELSIAAKRQDAPPATSTYPLPLKLIKPEKAH